MKNSYIDMPKSLVLCLVLLFCRKRVEREDGGWIVVYKTFRGTHYLVHVGHEHDQRKRFKLVVAK